MPTKEKVPLDSNEQIKSNNMQAKQAIGHESWDGYRFPCSLTSATDTFPDL